tara:strand:+ start:1478 stop:2392 length:915 start_codon:yes stop_codon:yes gene_type:complete
MNNWKSLGLIVKTKKKFDWLQTHMWVPVVDNINNNYVNVYFSSRNKKNFSSTGVLKFYPNNLKKKILIKSQPVIKLGNLGLFDDSAAVACTLVNYKGNKYLYYVGWMQGKRIRYHPSIGLATLKPKQNKFKKLSFAPLIPKSDLEPYGMASPFVMYDKDKKIWHMWYASYRYWKLRKKDPWPHYEIRYASSFDGINWNIKGRKCLGSSKLEAVARPYVIKEKNIFKMWYCYRKNYGHYKIGYAESKNGIDWKVLNHKFKLKLSGQYWDSQMQAYPCVFKFKGKKYMLYNGNNFGVDGIGLAVES